MDLSHVDYLWIIVMFLSALVLTAPIHCRIILGGLSVSTFSHFHFWVNYFNFFITVFLDCLHTKIKSSTLLATPYTQEAKHQPIFAQL